MTYHLAAKSLCALVFVLVCVAAEAFGLTHPDSYHYLRQSGYLADKTINDNGTFQDVLVRSTQLTLPLKHFPVQSYKLFTHVRLQVTVTEQKYQSRDYFLIYCWFDSISIHSLTFKCANCTCLCYISVWDSFIRFFITLNQSKKVEKWNRCCQTQTNRHVTSSQSKPLKYPKRPISCWRQIVTNAAFTDILSLDPKETKSACEEWTSQAERLQREHEAATWGFLQLLLCVCVSQNSMRTMQFTEENIGEILRLLAGILHAGNIEFMTAGGAQVSSKSGGRVSPHLPLSLLLSMFSSVQQQYQLFVQCLRSPDEDL